MILRATSLGVLYIFSTKISNVETISHYIKLGEDTDNSVVEHLQ